MILSKENKKTIEVYGKTAHLYLINSSEHDKFNLIKVLKKREKLGDFIKMSFSSLSEGAKFLRLVLLMYLLR